MVEHRSEKPGVDSSILSLGIFYLYGFDKCVLKYDRIKAVNKE